MDLATTFLSTIIIHVLNYEKLYNNGVQACGTCRGDMIGLPRDITKANSDKVKKLKRGEATYSFVLCTMYMQGSELCCHTY